MRFIRILGRTWELRFCKLRKRWGTCSDPAHSPRVIQLDDRLKGKKLIEISVHEALHAAQWHIDEEFVRRFAKDIANMLHDELQFRREGE
jgi:hypothetical protein